MNHTYTFGLLQRPYDRLGKTVVVGLTTENNDPFGVFTLRHRVQHRTTTTIKDQKGLYDVGSPYSDVTVCLVNFPS